MTSTFEIIESIQKDLALPQTLTEKLWQAQEQELLHSSDFQGKISTKLFTDNQYVLKIRSELEFSALNAKRWILQQLEKERKLMVAHPTKTWLLIHQAQNCYIANLTPYLPSLHQLQSSTPQTIVSNIKAYFSLYISVCQALEYRLDEGLSNYGLDSKGSLYYLDDDLYTWDQFIAFTESIGMLIRLIKLEDLKQWQDVAEYLGKCVIDIMQDRHWLLVLTEQVRELFTANEYQNESKSYLLQGLWDSYKNYQSSKHIKKTTVEDETEDSSQGLALEIEEEIIESTETHQAPGVLLSEPELDINKPFLVLADIHSNYTALEAVLNHLASHDIHQGIVLGDIVGYGPHPKECINAIRENNFVIIKGNHDHGVASHSEHGFNVNAAIVIEWTYQQLSQKDKNWLGNLPSFWQKEDFLAVHGAPIDRTFFNGYVYRMTYEDNLAHLKEKGIRYCFHGHTHMSGVYTDKGFTDHYELSLAEFNPALICPGSIGQPRNHQTSAEYAVFYPKEKFINYYRVPYTIEKTADAMQALGFPARLIGRLYVGQ